MVAIRKLGRNFVATLVDQEVLIVDLDGGELFSLSGTAKSVWEAIDGRRDVAGIAAIMTKGHQGEPGVIARDVAELIDQFEAAALVERV